MSVLSDRSIRRQITAGNLVISPFNNDLVQPASYDVTLGVQFLELDKPEGETKSPQRIIDPFINNEYYFKKMKISNYCPFIILRPGQFVLASTMEYFEIPNNLIARVEGKSSLGRLGLVVHQTAGFVDPGFKGNITLEIVNSLPYMIKLYPGMLIAQIAFEYLDNPADQPYGSKEKKSKYQNDSGPQISRYHLNPMPDAKTLLGLIDKTNN